MRTINQSRFFWPVLAALLALALIGSSLYWQQRLRAAPAKKQKRDVPPFDKRELAFLNALSRRLDYQPAQPFATADAARLAAYDVIDANRQRALFSDSPVTTFASRDPGFTHRSSIPLAASFQVSLSPSARHWKYELVNHADRILPAPILFKTDRWDSAADLVEQSGLKKIDDELDRALAIWRFIFERRVLGYPVTEGEEEHDLIKFLSLYGYGFCDDTARAVATLAELCGLRARVWGLEGHVVSEIFAAGRWRMLDADQGAYFHQPGEPRQILGVGELAASRAAFAHLVSLQTSPAYPPAFIDYFLERADNRIIAGGTGVHLIRPALRPNERMVFTNYNWGRYFLGKYPDAPPRFYNGWFEYSLRAEDLGIVRGQAKIEPLGGGCRLVNHGAESSTIALPVAYPFPIVGGEITGRARLIKGKAGWRIEDQEHSRSMTVPWQEELRIGLDRFIAILTSTPTTRYTLLLELGPETEVELQSFQVISDIQLARMALLPLETGTTEIRAVFPADSDPDAFELNIFEK